MGGWHLQKTYLLTVCAVETKNKTLHPTPHVALTLLQILMQNTQTTRVSELHRWIQLGFLFIARESQLFHAHER